MSTRSFLVVDQSVSTSQPDHVTGMYVTNGSTRLGLDVNMIDGVDRVHTRTHQGRAYVVSHIFSLAASTSANLLVDLTTGAGHFAFHMTTDANSYFQVFEGTTVSSNGTTLTAINNRRDVALTSDHKFYFAPTINNDGNTLCAFYVPAGTGNFSSGGESGGLPRGGAEWVLAASTKYLARVTNRSNAAIEASLSISFYVDI